MHRQADQNEAPTSAVRPISGWKIKQTAEIKRDPGQIEQRDRAQAGEIRADGVEIAQRQVAVAAVAGAQRQPHHRVVDAAAQRLVERAADARQNAAADGVEQAERGEQAADQHRQADQRRGRAARQHAVIDLEHEHGARQHQDIAHAGNQRGAGEGATAGGERVREFGTRVRGTGGRAGRHAFDFAPSVRARNPGGSARKPPMCHENAKKSPGIVAEKLTRARGWADDAAISQTT